ncbi:hypothetical protein F5141DRAFT_1060828 [Pisolithus sp. B1]|nr:hypothetical protein F5141DRAFT_1060828 [Pisolithus sp. B1]
MMKELFLNRMEHWLHICINAKVEWDFRWQRCQVQYVQLQNGVYCPNGKDNGKAICAVKVEGETNALLKFGEEGNEYVMAGETWAVPKIVATILITHHLLYRDDAIPVIFDGHGGFEMLALPDVPSRAEMFCSPKNLIMTYASASAIIYVFVRTI